MYLLVILLKIYSVDGERLTIPFAYVHKKGHGVDGAVHCVSISFVTVLLEIHFVPKRKKIFLLFCLVICKKAGTVTRVPLKTTQKNDRQITCSLFIVANKGAG